MLRDIGSVRTMRGETGIAGMRNVVGFKNDVEVTRDVLRQMINLCR